MLRGCLLLSMVFEQALKSMRLGLHTLIDFPTFLGNSSSNSYLAIFSLSDSLRQRYKVREEICLDCVQEPLMLRGLRAAQATAYNKY